MVVGTLDAFVGRTAELAQAVAALRQDRGGVALVLVSGEAGVGKTRLVQEVAAAEAANGTHVVSGLAWEGAGAPALWPWIQVVRSLTSHPCGGPGPPELDVLASGSEGAADASTIDSGSRFRLFDALAARLGRCARAQPLLVVLEDLHWADGSSVDALRFVVRSVPTNSLGIVATFRDTELPPTHPLADALPDLDRHGLRIALSGLSANEVAALSLAITGRPIERAVTNAVHARTGGNPFYAKEILRLIALSHVDISSIPPSVAEVVDQRVARLPHPVARLLDVAAVLGNDFDVELVAAMTESDAASLLDDIDRAVQARLLRANETVPGRYRFTHAIVRETLYQRIPARRRRDLHRAAARALDVQHPSPETQSIVAHHLAEALDPEAPVALMWAADATRRRYAFAEAGALLTRALALLPAYKVEARARALLELGAVLRLDGRIAESRATFERVIDIAEMTGDVLLLAGAALGFAGPHLGRLLRTAGSGPPRARTRRASRRSR